jgi:hypothetical protein
MLLEWPKLARMPEAQLATYDIALVHLACAAGLPGSEAIDDLACARKIDSLVPGVGRFTDYYLAKGARDFPEETEAQTRMRCLVEFAWRGAGIRYNMAKVPEDAPWELADTFAHGALFGPGGTCASLPVIYTALGRRLGYPLKLVEAWRPRWQHLFCRWDGDGERFNVEVNATGVGFPPDDHYRHPALGPEQEREGLYLRSKTPRQELAGFLAERACCWRDSGSLRGCVDSLAWAAGLAPENRVLLNTARARYNEWLREVKRREPAGFPELWLKVKERRYPEGLPLEVERDVVCLRTTEDLLNDPRAESRWWAALRQRDRWARTPCAVDLDSTASGVSCAFRFPARA